MSEEARFDATGAFVRVVVDGNKRNDVAWEPGRILLSDKRLVLVRSEGKHTVPLSAVTGVKARNDPETAPGSSSGYLSLQAGSDVTLVATRNLEAFERDLYDALLDGEQVRAKHPAVAGGVVQDAGWEGGRVSASGSRIDLAIASGTFVEIPLDDVGRVGRSEATIDGARRRVVEVEHGDDGTSVETHVTGTLRTASLLESFLRRGVDQSAPDVDLGEAELQVLMALYSGVSPFEIPDFVDMDVDEVEAVYERLVEEEVLEPVRTRREVQLEARGRSIAAEEVGDG